MRQVVYAPEIFGRMDSWPLEFAVLVVAANGTGEHRSVLTIFDQDLNIEELQAVHTTRLYHLVESAILAGELEITVGPIMKSMEQPRITGISTNGNGSSCRIQVPECAYTCIDVFDNPDMRPVEAPHFVRASTPPGSERYVKRKAFCTWVQAKGFHVPADLLDKQVDKASRPTLSTNNTPCDVFLAHNSKDKPVVLAIGEALKKRGFAPWIDIEQIPPGRWFQDVIQGAIREAKSAAICIGPDGLGRWEAVELRTFISQCVEREIPVIPVLLPGVEGIPEPLVFLRELNAVKFNAIDDEDALRSLVWGITGERS